MDRSWMRLPNRSSWDYVEGAKSFIQITKKHLRWDDKTRCPCRDSQNARFNALLTSERHSIRFGFSTSYQKWIFQEKELNCVSNGQNDMDIDAEMVDTIDDELIDALNDAYEQRDKDMNLKESNYHGKFENLFYEAK